MDTTQTAQFLSNTMRHMSAAIKQELDKGNGDYADAIWAAGFIVGSARNAVLQS